MITWSAIWQSWATWAPTMNRQSSPMRVTIPPPVVPGFIVTYSRIVLRQPTIKDDSSPQYLRSCGSSPIEAKGKIRVPSPIVVCPSTTTCARNVTPVCRATCLPTMQNGPTTTSRAKLASGATMAVGWICAIASSLLVEDHRSVHSLGYQIVADLGPALEFPHIAAIALFDDLNAKGIAGKHRAAEPGIIDAHEIDELDFRFR